MSFGYFSDHGLSKLVREPDQHYPIHWLGLYDVVDPDLTEKVKTAIGGCPLLHLWFSRFWMFGFQSEFMPPAGSFLALTFARHGGIVQTALDDAAVLRHIKLVRDQLVLEIENGLLRTDAPQEQLTAITNVITHARRYLT